MSLVRRALRARAPHPLPQRGCEPRPVEPHLPLSTASRSRPLEQAALPTPAPRAREAPPGNPRTCCVSNKRVTKLKSHEKRTLFSNQGESVPSPSLSLPPYPPLTPILISEGYFSKKGEGQSEQFSEEKDRVEARILGSQVLNPSVVPQAPRGAWQFPGGARWYMMRSKPRSDVR